MSSVAEFCQGVTRERKCGHRGCASFGISVYAITRHFGPPEIKNLPCKPCCNNALHFSSDTFCVRRRGNVCASFNWLERSFLKLWVRPRRAVKCTSWGNDLPYLNVGRCTRVRTRPSSSPREHLWAVRHPEIYILKELAVSEG